MKNKTLLSYLIGLGLGTLIGSTWTGIYYKNKMDVEHAEINGILKCSKIFLKNDEKES